MLLEGWGELKMFKNMLNQQNFDATEEEIKEALLMTTDDIKANNILLNKRTNVKKAVEIIKTSIDVIRRCKGNG